MKFNLLIILLYFSQFFYCSNVDTLKILIDKSHGNEKCLLIHKLCDQYKYLDSDSTYKYCKLGLISAKQIKDTTLIADFTLEIANYLFGTGDNSNALDNYIEAESLYKMSKNLKGKLIVAINIGMTYQQQGLYEKSKNKYMEAYSISKENKYFPITASALNSLGTLYYSRHNKRKALDYFIEALEVNKLIDDKYRIMECLNNIGVVYQELKEFDKALKYFQDYLNYSKLNNFKESINIAYHNIALVYKDQGNYIDACQYLDSSILYAKKINDYENLIDIYSTYAELHSERKNYQKAFEAINLKYQAKDSLLMRDKNKTFAEMSTKYETEKKESENKRLKAESDRQKILNYAISIGLVFVIILAFFIYKNYSVKKKANLKLEAQNVEIKEQKHVIEEKQKEILDSINYAKRIQYTLLAHDNFLKEHLPAHFVLFKPKDIVSGDFYWAAKKDNRFYLAVCDSTGHGVPGAFMSLLNIGFLSEAINEKGIEQPGDILNHVRQRLIDNISKEGQKDGFDGILLCIENIQQLKNNNGLNISYAAANNAPVLVKDSAYSELEKDKMPVGLGIKDDSFKTNSIQLHKGDSIYLYTDGYADQFGGPKGKKFKYKPLNELILKHSTDSLSDQRDALLKTFNDWVGKLEQVDDVCMIGLRY